MINRRLSQLLGLCILALASGECSGGTGPSMQLRLGDHALASIDGSPLPAALPNGSSVVAGRLHVGPDGVVMEQTLAPVSGSAGTVQIVQQENFTISQSGETFLLQSVERSILDTGYVEDANIIVRHHSDGTTTGPVQTNTYSR